MKLRQTPAPDLKSRAVAILLRGWGATPPTDVLPDAHGFGGGMLLLFDVDGPARLWREHGDWLRSIARSWGWEPSITGPDDVLRFYAEHCAAGFSER